MSLMNCQFVTPVKYAVLAKFFSSYVSYGI